MANPEEINADMFAFWDGLGGRTWVARQEHTDCTLTSVTKALLAFAAPCPGRACTGCRLRLWWPHSGICAGRQPLGSDSGA